jgi:hypothetical protein
MIRKFVALLSLTLMVSASALAQNCTPDPALKAPGTLPKNLPDGDFQQAYDQTITVMAFPDTTVVVGGQPQYVKIDSFKVKGIIGLPQGLSYACWDASCVYPPDSLRCIRINGTPNEGGMFPILIPITIYAKVGGFFAVQQPDTMRGYSITINGGSSGLVYVGKGEQARLFEQNDQTFVLGMKAAELQVYNLSGQLMPLSVEPFGAALRLHSEGLKPGMYILTDGRQRLKWWVKD